jgi:hypothetical protein
MTAIRRLSAVYDPATLRRGERALGREFFEQTLARIEAGWVETTNRVIASIRNPPPNGR